MVVHIDNGIAVAVGVNGVTFVNGDALQGGAAIERIRGIVATELSN